VANYSYRGHKASGTNDRRERAQLKADLVLLGFKPWTRPRLWVRLDFSWKDFYRFLIEQDGRCPLCGRSLRKRIVVDHDHSTGKVRGLLHNRCNSMLGWYETNEVRIRTYLE